ncbi:sensor histidine kinase [Bifidobacterium moukalabense]|uniref:sensor histidine kinase n=1 Tax=Bifidobacterium moukalabense TaxID=1333651 RepID=UPI0010F67CF7|nr:histidine kinase [Bifidobacterium moukalabense]
MRRLIFQGLLMVMGVVLGIAVIGDVPRQLVYAVVLAICCAAVGEYTRFGIAAIAVIVSFSLGAVWYPGMCWLLPVVAVDAAAIRDDGSLRRMARSGMRKCVTLCVRWSWTIPLAGLAIRKNTAGLAWDREWIAVLAMLAMLGFGIGLQLVRFDDLSLQAKRLQDTRRNQIRQLRNRLSESEEDRAASVRSAILSERTRIAREIHDNVGHLLTRAIMQSEASQVVARISGQDAAARGFEDIHATVNEAMTMVRRSVHDLKDRGTDFTAQIGAASQAMGLEVVLDNAIDDAPAAVARCFATTIREALNNTVRHSDARAVHVTLRDMPALWQLVVQDDGHAISTESHDDGGIGLADIEERARALGGSAVCGPYHGGWRVFVSVPKSKEASS